MPAGRSLPSLGTAAQLAASWWSQLPRCKRRRRLCGAAMPAGAAAARSEKAKKRLLRWLDDYDAVSAWVEGKLPDLTAALAAGGGFVHVKNFFPEVVATGLLEVLQSIPDAAWNLTAADDDLSSNNIRHAFLSIKQGPRGLAEAFRALSLLSPDSLHTFSAAKYEQAGHIAPHDDRAYCDVRMDDGRVELCSRSVAVILYLTRGWAPEDGGALVDLEGPQGRAELLPAFNSLVAFTIPRWHEVRPVTGGRPRYSLFGWFLEPGKLYGLNTRTPPPPRLVPKQQQQQQPQQQQEQQLKAQQGTREKKKKRQKKTRSCLTLDPGQLRQQQQQREQRLQQQQQQLLHGPAQLELRPARKKQRQSGQLEPTDNGK